MDLDEALEQMALGGLVRRPGWPSDHHLRFISCLSPICTTRHMMGPTPDWQPSHTDIIADDWELAGLVQ